MTEHYPQTPGPGEIFLDHVGWFVPDMAAAAPKFETLGFPLTPFTVHMNEQPDGSKAPSGTANRCAMIRRGYLEVLTRIPDIDSAITQQLDAGLARYTGLHLIAFTVSDTEAATARLRENGFSPDPPVALRRPMPLDDGGEATAAFSVIRLPNDAMAEGRVQVLSQDTPDVVWQPSVTAEANGAAMLSGILICAADPAETAVRYERFTGKEARASGDGFRISLDRGELAICTREECAALIPGINIPDLPFMAAVSVVSRDVGQTREFLAANGIPLVSEGPHCVIVDADAGMGANFIFHAADRKPFPQP
ncbi:MAG: VOC family protein [Alphaproteobacteria bacterium]